MPKPGIGGEGRDSPALPAALDKAEAELSVLKMQEADAWITAATIHRPTVERVQEAWGRILDPQVRR